jgi:hypothetical protein
MTCGPAITLATVTAAPARTSVSMMATDSISSEPSAMGTSTVFFASDMASGREGWCLVFEKLGLWCLALGLESNASAARRTKAIY